MTIARAELAGAARDALAGGGLAPDPETGWRTVVELGLLTVGVPEAAGGLGLGDEAVAAAHHELGRALVPGPAIAQMLAVAALAAGDGGATGDLLARAMAGEVMTAPLGGAAGAAAVPDADRASRLLVVGPDRVALVPLAGARLTRRPTWDATRRLFDVEPAAAAADGAVLAAGAAAAALGLRLDSLRSLMLAADSLGGADAILALTVDHLGTRRQFGRPLAMFQALKHRVADLKTRLAAAQALLWTRAAAPLDAADAAALKAHATRTYAAVAEEAVQLHGGIGLTTEHHCHLFLKRALLNAALGRGNDDADEAVGRRLLAA